MTRTVRVFASLAGATASKPLVQDSNLGFPNFNRALYRLSEPAMTREGSLSRGRRTPGRSAGRNRRGRDRTGAPLYVTEALFR